MSAIIDCSVADPSAKRLRALDQTTGIFSGGVNTPLTIAAWVKEVTDTTGNQCAVGLNRGNTNNHSFSIRTSAGATSSDINGTARTNAAGSGGVAGTTPDHEDILDTWLLLVGVFESDNLTQHVYLSDGTNTYSGTENASSGTPTSIDSINIGTEKEFQDSAATLTVAEIAIWNTALSAANVTDLVTKTADQVAAANLQHYWPLYDDLLDDAGSVTLVDVNANVTLSTVDHPSLSASGTTIPLVSRHLQNMMSN